jgi:RNA polymerase sigma-70 factor (ECF subfamily)
MAEGKLELTPGYIYRTAYSAVIDEIRRRRRLQEVAIELEIPAQSYEGDPEHRALAREMRDAIMKCLVALGPPRRRAVTLHLLGHSVAEISRLLECRHKQAENLVYRGVSNLRHCLRRRGVTL